jgi:uncharacterized membrane protein
MNDPWIRTIAHPASHLISTVAIFALLIACTVLSVIDPQLMWLFGIVGGVPVVLWYLFMMKAYKTERARWRTGATPPNVETAPRSSM